MRNFILSFTNILSRTVVANSLVSGIWFSISPIIMLRIAVVAKPLMSGILFSIFPIFFSNFRLSLFYWLVWIKVYASGIFFSKLFNFVFGVNMLIRAYSFITNKITRSFSMVLLGGINNSDRYIMKICWYFGYIFQEPSSENIQVKWKLNKTIYCKHVAITTICKFSY